MIELTQIILISVIAYALGYYTKSKTQTLMITDTINGATDILETATDTFKNFKADTTPVEKVVKQDTAELEKLDKKIEAKKTELKEWESKADTAKHTKWKKEREEKIVIVKVLKDEKNKALREERAETEQKVKADNGIKDDKPDFLK